MSREELEIVITPQGEVKINVLGAGGKGCLDISKFLEASLGDVTKREFKPEYYQTSTQRQKNVLIHEQY